MQSTQTILQASNTKLSSLVAATKEMPLSASLSLAQDGEVLVDGVPAPQFRDLAGLVGCLPDARAVTLKRLAIEEHIKRAEEKVIAIVVENLNGQKKVFTQGGFRWLDGLSKDLVEVGGVYVGYLSRQGFVLIKPEDEVVLGTATEVLTHFGSVAPFIFDALWARIRQRESEEAERARVAAEERLAAARIAAEERQRLEEEAKVQELFAGGKLVLGGFSSGLASQQ
jgi:hypothetical protein